MISLSLTNKVSLEQKNLKGIFPIVYSFFNKNNSLDIKLMKEQIQFVQKIGSNGIACLGLATEVHKLSFNEKKIIIEMIAEQCNGKIPIAVTIQGSSLSEQIKLINVANSNKASWIILQPFLKSKNTTEKECFSFYKKIIPYTKNTTVGIQNAIEYMGVGLTTKNILKLYKSFPNFRAIKGESSSVFIGNEIKQFPKNLYVFNGRGGAEIIDNLRVGCKGIIPAPDCADKFVKIYHQFLRKDFNKAYKEYQKVLPAIVFIMQSINTLVCYGKRVFAYRMGIKSIYDRKPFLTPTDYGIKKSKDIAKYLGTMNV
jgi:4-hydroxy-tetrahydrodipicolinate synthase